MAMNQAETFEWLRERSNRLDAAESQLAALRAEHEKDRQAIEFLNEQLRLASDARELTRREGLELAAEIGAERDALRAEVERLRAGIAEIRDNCGCTDDCPNQCANCDRCDALLAKEPT